MQEYNIKGTTEIFYAVDKFNYNEESLTDELFTRAKKDIEKISPYISLKGKPYSINLADDKIECTIEININGAFYGESEEDAKDEALGFIKFKESEGNYILAYDDFLNYDNDEDEETYI